jgi:hypothetical protein
VALVHLWLQIVHVHKQDMVGHRHGSAIISLGVIVMLYNVVLVLLVSLIVPVPHGDTAHQLSSLPTIRPGRPAVLLIALLVVVVPRSADVPEEVYWILSPCGLRITTHMNYVLLFHVVLVLLVNLIVNVLNRVILLDQRIGILIIILGQIVMSLAVLLVLVLVVVLVANVINKDTAVLLCGQMELGLHVLR